jgi:hypothetical protein
MAEFQDRLSDPDAYETFMGRWSELLAPIFIGFTGIGPGTPDEAIPATEFIMLSHLLSCWP